jgi:hypothetical protein
MSLRYSRKDIVMIRWLLDGPLKGFPDLPPVWLIGFMAAAWLIDRGLPLVEAFGPVYQVAGGLLMLAALGLIAWSALVVLAQENDDRAASHPHRPDRGGTLQAQPQSHLPRAADPSGGLRPAPGVSWALDPALRLLLGPHPPLHRAGGGGLRRLFGAEAHAYLEKHPPLALGRGVGGGALHAADCHRLSRRLDWFVRRLRLKWICQDDNGRQAMKRLLAGMGLALGPRFGRGRAWRRTRRPTGPVVVELFTSQGCSACPPADMMMADLAARDDVIALSLHVDYWNYLGWEDTFSQAVFTERQYGYGRAAGSTVVYTPQIIVGGQDRVMGARAMELADRIAAHRAAPDPVALEVAGGAGRGHRDRGALGRSDARARHGGATGRLFAP